MINQLITNFSNGNIRLFFESKITSFKPEQEVFENIVSEEKPFADPVKVGIAELNNHEELLVFTCKYEDELTARSSKKKQFDIAKRILKEDFKDGAIFIFYDAAGNFRFSFIRKNYGSETSKYSNWKRFTYYVEQGKTNRTFRERIGNGDFSSLESIREAFSVEPLNKEFYSKIVRSFYHLVGGKVGSGRSAEDLKPLLSLPEGEKDRTIVRQFGVRLIGRVVFCWFLKHKTSKNKLPLIPEEWLSSDAITEDYYHTILEPLFYEVLNKKPQNRDKALPKGHEQIPFLNGGLFEAQEGTDSDFYYPQKSLPQRSNYQLKLPNEWFEELFEVLEQYNFTIDENSVSDAEVSIDPEMLGRIFENLLAEIDPNIKSEEKKSIKKATGSFYTPREIVDHMVVEALVKYLHHKTGVPERRLHLLFKDSEEVAFKNFEINSLMDAFDEVKILDPACGSGAFPMGALQKIIFALHKLDPDAQIWKQKQLGKINNAALRAEMKETLAKANAEYARKLGVLQQCIYGSDIQPIASEISKLRSFLSLIIDEEIDDNKYNRGILPLPNLEFKFVTANTLIELDNSGSLESELVTKMIPELHRIRQDYLQAHGSEKEQLKNEFQKIQTKILKDQVAIDPRPETRAMQLVNWNPFNNKETDWFDPEWMFGIKQFDIVIGNPPYGGTKISAEVKSQLGLGSSDPYGAFIAKYLRRKKNNTPLSNNGILSFIVSDTFMTIKSHRELRNLILENKILSMLRVHPDTFKATVNTAIVTCQRLEGLSYADNSILMADFSNVSIQTQHERFLELLEKTIEYKQPEYLEEFTNTDDVLFMKGKDWCSESSDEYAIYKYPQKLIETNSNLPFFVASPKLYKLMNDTTSSQRQVSFKNKQFTTREIDINSKKVIVIKLGKIADVKQGLATGDNDSYLFQRPEARGTYRDITLFEQYLLNENDLARIRSNEKLRKSVINRGISIKNSNSERFFGGRYIIPHDKGGESDINSGWLPNYNVETNYFIDWSEWAVDRIKTLKGSNGRLKSRFQNTNFYFLQGIDYSQTGVYCPTFRVNSGANFNTEATSIFPLEEVEKFLGKVSSKKVKYLIKNFIDHTVHASVDKLKEVHLCVHVNDDVEQLVHRIIEKQNVDKHYDYASSEQIAIDYLVYQAYGLDWSDVREVENWYARRYSRLTQSQKRNLLAEGKSSDYLENYRSLATQYGDLALKTSSEAWQTIS